MAGRSSRRDVADLRGYRVLETYPPVYYLPPESIRPGSAGSVRRAAPGASLRAAPATGPSSWQAAGPSKRLVVPRSDAAIRGDRGYLAFYASRVDQCWVGEERVRPAGPRDFYGGWITSRVVGPFRAGRHTGLVRGDVELTEFSSPAD